MSRKMIGVPVSDAEHVLISQAVSIQGVTLARQARDLLREWAYVALDTRGKVYGGECDGCGASDAMWYFTNHHTFQCEACASKLNAKIHPNVCIFNGGDRLPKGELERLKTAVKTASKFSRLELINNLVEAAKALTEFDASSHRLPSDIAERVGRARIEVDE